MNPYTLYGLARKSPTRTAAAGLCLVAMLALPGFMRAQQQKPSSQPPSQNSGQSSSASKQSSQSGQQDMQGMGDMKGMAHDQMDMAQKGANEQMIPGHQHMGAHMKMSATRPASPEDWARADQVAGELRGAIEKYKDYHVALADGFVPFLPKLPQPMYHFTNNRNGFLEAFTFDPGRPTSLLYKKTATGYELIGAMYTMPVGSTEEQLNERVPLGVAPWHLHTNLCVPRQGQKADWTRFGLNGSIATQSACDAAGGRFFPIFLGWMVHVYPFEPTREKVWGQ